MTLPFFSPKAPTPPPGPKPAQVGDFIIWPTGSPPMANGAVVTKVTATRYYYLSTKYVAKTTVVWVGTQAAGQAVLTSIAAAWKKRNDALAAADAAYQAGFVSIINNAGGWA